MLPLMNGSKHSNISYTPIDTAESDSLLFDSESPDRKAIPLANPGLTRNSGLYFFLVSCTIALVISAFNSAFLSVTNSYQIFATSKPSRAPSVYMGLENLPPNKSVCRSRMTFPKQFATFRGDNLNGMTPVHAPGDKVSLSFGGEISAHVDYYVPDYGLNNCTVTIKSIADPYPVRNANSTVEIWRLSDSGSLSDKVLLGTLTLSQGTSMESTTKPFYCPSRSHMFFQWRCPQKDCSINLPLEGVTTMTASAESLTKTGIRLNQYELLSCARS
ncbi:hypothetical protein PILCRDRAFT_811817 [Piloderma croceum F 1598]|uniref:Ubiquitin 3 binding protein But2 C-terminal domain-containing protein n=1 Tax=Piloderma croceum (strain F 1598) TaxID=765440 RepID=A0A0C3BUB8_PILCF|nr:hypothetical protein PILCRDRAFT_811817 [Piloderma croceum F 1598]